MGGNTDHKIQEVDLWPVDKLKPYEDNAKLHPPEKIDALVKLIQNVGYRKPIEITADGTVVNGHGRLMAVKKMGWKYIQATVIADLTPDEIKQYRIADNKVAESGYDNEKLKKDVLYLQSETDIDMSVFFTEKEFDFLAGDLEQMDLSAITGNLANEVEEMSSTTQASIDAESDKKSTLTKAFGYTKISETEQRSIARLQAHAEGMTGLKEGAALSLFIKEHLCL